ncbi:hypothetical protein DXG03_005012 [Asterophora parasitica]|uniref:BTB domain-containing protein n=1 Tax=Asterophora parasitica TaxID=117018 RepID=A0A9P7GH07_9AGAR|nr:hypothetical protein DXG03_005012 [Asterophora parasitica]
MQHWFEDGNIILLTDETPTMFRGRHSDVFRDMLSMPQPEALSDAETYDGCQLVRLYDLPSDVSNLIKAIYDGAHFRQDSFADFIYLAGVLRLSTKYLIAHLRAQAIRFLATTWPHTLEGHDAMVNKAVSTPTKDGLSYPYVHPLHVLNLANELNVRIVIPSAVYFLSLYPLSDVLRADHPKLLAKHPSRLSSSLGPAELVAYTLMYQHRVKIILEFIRKERTPSTACIGESTCPRGFQKQASRLLRSWQTRTGPLYFIVQAMNAVEDEPLLCEPCRKAYRRDAELLRQKIWRDLPEAISLPNWDDLVEGDLPPSMFP